MQIIVFLFPGFGEFFFNLEFNSIDLIMLLANSQPQPVECRKSLAYSVHLNQSLTCSPQPHYAVDHYVSGGHSIPVHRKIAATALFTAHSSRRNNFEEAQQANHYRFPAQPLETLCPMRAATPRTRLWPLLGGWEWHRHPL